MMKKLNTTLGGLCVIHQSIMEKDVVNMPFSRKGGLSVARNIKKIENELIEYYKERDELIRKYSNGESSIDKSNPKWDEFVEECNAINNIEVSLDLNTITEEDLPESCSPAVCLIVDFMMEEQPETEE